MFGYVKLQEHFRTHRMVYSSNWKDVWPHLWDMEVQNRYLWRNHTNKWYTYFIYNKKHKYIISWIASQIEYVCRFRPAPRLVNTTESYVWNRIIRPTKLPKCQSTMKRICPYHLLLSSSVYLPSDLSCKLTNKNNNTRHFIGRRWLLWNANNTISSSFHESSYHCI